MTPEKVFIVTGPTEREELSRLKLTGVCITIHACQLKFHEPDNTLEASIALEILCSSETPTTFRRHTDDNPCSVFVGRNAGLVFIVVRKRVVIQIEYLANVVVFWIDIGILYLFAMHNTFLKVSVRLCNRKKSHLSSPSPLESAWSWPALYTR